MSAPTTERAIIPAPTDIPPTFGDLQHPELTVALHAAERAGFLRGLGMASALCRDAEKAYDAAGRLRDRFTEREQRDRYFVQAEAAEALAARILGCDGRDGADVRDHCGQFAWSGEGEQL